MGDAAQGSFTFTSAEDLLAQTEAIIEGTMKVLKDESKSDKDKDNSSNSAVESSAAVAAAVGDNESDGGQSGLDSLPLDESANEEDEHHDRKSEEVKSQYGSDIDVASAINSPNNQSNAYSTSAHENTGHLPPTSTTSDKQTDHSGKPVEPNIHQDSNHASSELGIGRVGLTSRSRIGPRTRNVEDEYVTNMSLLHSTSSRSTRNRVNVASTAVTSRPPSTASSRTTTSNSTGSKPKPETHLKESDFVQLVYGDAPGDLTGKIKVSFPSDHTKSDGSVSGKDDNDTTGGASGTPLGRVQALRRAGVKPGMWCLALEAKLRPDAATALVNSTLSELLLSHHLVVILREHGRLVAELRDRSLSAVGTGQDLVSVVRTITIIHGLAEKDKQRLLWVCVVGGKASAEGAIETIGSFATSLASALFEPTARQRETLSKGTNALFVIQLFDSIQHGLLESGMTLSSLPIRPRSNVPLSQGARRRVNITVKDLLRRGGLAEQSLDHEYLASLMEVYSQQLNRELEVFAQPLELFARDQEWRLAQLISLLRRAYEDCHLPIPVLERAPRLDSFPLDEVAPKPAVFHREPTTREVDSLTKHALSAKCYSESNARKKRKHLEVTERVNVCERNRVKFVQILRDSEAALASKTTLEFLELFQLNEPEAVLCQVSCMYLGKMGTLYITFNRVCFYCNLLGFRTRVTVSMSDCRSVHKTKGSGALAMITGEGILIREFRHDTTHDTNDAAMSHGETIDHTFILPASADCARVFEILIQITRMQNTTKFAQDHNTSRNTMTYNPVENGMNVDGLRGFGSIGSENGDAMSEGSLSIASSNASELAGGAAGIDLRHFDRLTSNESEASAFDIRNGVLHLPSATTGSTPLIRSSSAGASHSYGTPQFHSQQQIGLPLGASVSGPSQVGGDEEGDTAMFFSSVNLSDSQYNGDAISSMESSVGSMNSQAGHGKTAVDTALRHARDAHQRHLKRTPLSPSIQALVSPTQSPHSSIHGDNSYDG